MVKSIPCPNILQWSYIYVAIYIYCTIYIHIKLHNLSCKPWRCTGSSFFNEKYVTFWISLSFSKLIFVVASFPLKLLRPFSFFFFSPHPPGIIIDITTTSSDRLESLFCYQGEMRTRNNIIFLLVSFFEIPVLGIISCFSNYYDFFFKL